MMLDFLKLEIKANHHEEERQLRGGQNEVVEKWKLKGSKYNKSHSEAWRALQECPLRCTLVLGLCFR